MVSAWAQLLYHDMVEVRESAGERLDMAVECGDELFDPASACDGDGDGDGASIPFSRAAAKAGSRPRVPVNMQTSFIDASAVYGSSLERQATLRMFAGGKLRSDVLAGVPLNPRGYAQAGPYADETQRLTGDPRNNETPGVLVLNGLLVLEHNRLCDELAAWQPEWGDERLFQEARRRVAALMQVITVEEFLPVLTGGDTLSEYLGYNDAVQPGVDVLWAFAAARFWLSSLNTVYTRWDGDHEPVAQGHLLLREGIYRPAYLDTHGLAPILRGLLRDPASNVDTRVVEDLRMHRADASLPAKAAAAAAGAATADEQPRRDLIAELVQRARDVGVERLNDARAAFGLAPHADFRALGADVRQQLVLERAYGGTEELFGADVIGDVEAVLGGLAERADAPGAGGPTGDALLGPLFAASFIEQLGRSRDGDRFWYENVFAPAAMTAGDDGIREGELEELRATRLADLIQRNTGIAVAVADGSSAFRTNPVPTSGGGGGGGDDDGSDADGGGGGDDDGSDADGGGGDDDGNDGNAGGGDGAGGGDDGTPATDASGSAVFDEMVAAVEDASLLSGGVGLWWPEPDDNYHYMSVSTELSVDGPRWVGIGFGDSMTNADMWVVDFSPPIDGSVAVRVTDYQSSGFSTPLSDVEAGGRNDVGLVGVHVDAEAGRVHALMRRMRAPVDNVDKPIDAARTDLIYAFGAGGLSYHGRSDRGALTADFAGGASPDAVEVTSTATSNIYILHGAGMLVAWVLVAPTAMLSVRYLKNYGFWLSYHRGAMGLVTTVVLTIATAAATLEHKDFRFQHAYVGLALIGVLTTQFFLGGVAIYMYNTTHPPWIFRPLRFIHRILGFGLMVGAVVNCYLGVQLLWPSMTTFYIVWVACFGAIFVALEVWRQFGFELFWYRSKASRADVVLEPRTSSPRPRAPTSSLSPTFALLLCS